MSNSHIKTFEMEWEGSPLIIEFNRFAGQSNASCTVRYGDTMVLVTAVMGEKPRDQVSYFPLMVEFKETLAAAGKISGSRFIKREGRPSDQATLSARLIDRSIRPLFQQDMRNDIQVVISMLSYDPMHDPDVAGMVGAAAALMTSNIPFHGPLAGCHVSVKDGEITVNAGAEAVEAADLNVFVSGRNMETVMLEADGKQADDNLVVDAIEAGLKSLQPVVEFLETIKSEIGQDKFVPAVAEVTAEDEAAMAAGKERAAAYYAEHGNMLFGQGNKRERKQRHEEFIDGLKATFTEDEAAEMNYAKHDVEEMFAAEMVKRIFEEGKRVDDRALDQIRPLSADTSLIPRIHGSGAFSRGDTQVLSTVTLSSPSNEQILDTMRHDEKRRYFHHYNFPPFSVGEARPFRSAGRREIGHGALAEKALIPVLPKKEDFPYTIRVISDVLSSNGSSSQGSICGSTLSLMDAGVPISAPVAGIAMGIAIKDAEKKDEYVILTDMQDVEDYERSMDFKVAGTRAGVTAIQLDIKFDGLTMDMVRDTMVKAKTAREEILDVMEAEIAAPRTELSPFAPRIEQVEIAQDKIGDLIGPGGKMIKSIIEKTGAQIDIEEEDGKGMVFITSEDQTSMDEALKWVKAITRVIKPGDVFMGKMVKLVADRNSGAHIGAIVQITPTTDGMVHISEVANERIDDIEAIMKVGDTVKVVVKTVDKEKGRIGLSRKAMLDQ